MGLNTTSGTINIDKDHATGLSRNFAEVSYAFSNPLTLGATDSSSTIAANGNIDVMLGYCNQNRNEFSANTSVDKQLWDSWIENMTRMDRELIQVG